MLPAVLGGAAAGGALSLIQSYLEQKQREKDLARRADELRNLPYLQSSFSNPQALDLRGVTDPKDVQALSKLFGGLLGGAQLGYGFANPGDVWGKVK